MPISEQQLLFDTNGQLYINQYNSSIFITSTNDSFKKTSGKKNILILEDTRCFLLRCFISNTDHEIVNETSIYFKNHVLIERTIIDKSTKQHLFEYELFPHELPLELLFTIKFFQANKTRDGLFQFNSHRECFLKEN